MLVVPTTLGQVIDHRTTVRVPCILPCVFVNVEYLDVYGIMSRYMFPEGTIDDLPFAYKEAQKLFEIKYGFASIIFDRFKKN